jgi:hypothetical protein
MYAENIKKRKRNWKRVESTSRLLQVEIPDQVDFTFDDQYYVFRTKKSSGSGALERMHGTGQGITVSCQAMREPWSTEEYPGKTEADYKMLIIIDEKFKNKTTSKALSVYLFIFRGEVDIFVHCFTSKK